MSPWVLKTLLQTLELEGCAFVGAFPRAFPTQDDVRPGQQRIDYWSGPVSPEAVDPGSGEWERWHLHRAANLHHVCQSIPPETGAPLQGSVDCIVRTVRPAKAPRCRRLPFWDRLPQYHSGEEGSCKIC